MVGYLHLTELDRMHFLLEAEEGATMPKIKRPRIAHTEKWGVIRQRTLWPEQEQYELIRPIVLFGETPAERAEQTGAAERTLYRRADRFDQEGMMSLLATEQAPPPETARSVPTPMRQAMVDLKAEYPAFTPNELSTIGYVQFGRRLSRHTVQRILAEGPLPSRTTRRYPPYAEMSDPAERRLAVIRLHVDGWSIATISRYLGVSRPTVYQILHRWVEEGVKGLEDKSRAPKSPSRKVTLGIMHEVKKLQRNPELGEWRIYAALKTLGIHLSPRTCGRILALNRSLYGLKMPRSEAHEPRPHPYRAAYRHHIWSVDLRYIEKHRLCDDKPVYILSVLDNFSRAILASGISKTQNLTDYLIVLFAAIRQHGAPAMLVSDSGSIFKAKQAMKIYKSLGIQKEQIEKRQSWQNLIESQFNLQRRLADFDFAQDETWNQMLATHAKWVADHNYQPHYAHKDRQDGRLSPAEVLGWVRGKIRTAEELHRIFYQTRHLRWLNKAGYLRFRHWRIYGEYGLAKRQVVIWLYEEHLTVEWASTPLAQYQVEYQPNKKDFRQVTPTRLLETAYQSPQRSLWSAGEVIWYQVIRETPGSRRRRQRAAGIAQQPSLF
jgi:putative transposase